MVLDRVMNSSMKTADYRALIERLRRRFPSLQSISRAPVVFLFGRGLFSFTREDFRTGSQNETFQWGTGLGLLGKRDVDSESGTYIKTRVFSLWSLQLFFLDAYRVLDWELALKDASDPNGWRDADVIVRHCRLIGPWYVIGKEPLTTSAKVWNVFVLLLLASLILLVSRYP